MFPCCQLCYDKYIKADGEIDQKRIKLAAKVESRGDKKRAEKLLEDPCRCECHQDGVACMH
jgi:hypothetical protein